MNYIDAKFVNLLAPKLRNFKKKNDKLWNFSCPICGDSSTNKSKARGYVFPKDTSLVFKCHNCSYSSSFQYLLKDLDSELYNQYILEKYKRQDEPEPEITTDTKREIVKRQKYLSTPLGKLKKVSQLKPTHPIKLYIQERMIPSEYHYKLFYSPKFFEFASQFDPKYGDEKYIKYDEPRLVIPFLDRERNLMAFQGRSLKGSKSPVKYYTIKVDENSSKLYGLDSIDTTIPVYVLEGPIDSMFIYNSIAMAGGDVSSDIIKSELGNCEIVYVFDNEPRSIFTIKRMEKIIKQGFQITIFPDYIKEKDINEMIIAGMDQHELNCIISNNVYSDLEAVAKLSEWRKV